MCNFDNSIKNIKKVIRNKLDKSLLKNRDLGCISYEENKPFYLPKNNINFQNVVCCGYDVLTHKDILYNIKCTEKVNNTYVCQKHEKIKINFVDKQIVNADCSNDGNEFLCDCETHDNIVNIYCFKNIEHLLMNNMDITFYPNKQIFTFKLTYNKTFLAKGYIKADYQLSGLIHIINLLLNNSLSFDNILIPELENSNMFMLRIEKFFLTQINIFNCITNKVYNINNSYNYYINFLNYSSSSCVFIVSYIYFHKKMMIDLKPADYQANYLFNLIRHITENYKWLIFNNKNFFEILFDKLEHIKDIIIYMENESCLECESNIFKLKEEYEGKLLFNIEEFKKIYYYYSNRVN